MRPAGLRPLAEVVGGAVTAGLQPERNPKGSPDSGLNGGQPGPASATCGSVVCSRRHVAHRDGSLSRLPPKRSRQGLPLRR